MNKKRWVMAGVFIGLAPLGVSILAFLFAGILGCEISARAQSVCLVGGKDFGGLLANLGFFHWLSIPGIPLGAVVAAVGSLFFSNSAPTTPHEISPVAPAPKNSPKQLITTGLLLIADGLIPVATLLFTRGVLIKSSSLPSAYLLINLVISPIVTFGTIFLVVSGAVYLLSGLAKQFALSLKNKQNIAPNSGLGGVPVLSYTEAPYGWLKWLFLITILLSALPVLALLLGSSPQTPAPLFESREVAPVSNKDTYEAIPSVIKTDDAVYDEARRLELKALEENNFAGCSAIGESVNSNGEKYRDFCYFHYVERYLDTSACPLIENATLSDNCWKLGSAEKKK